MIYALDASFLFGVALGLALFLGSLIWVEVALFILLLRDWCYFTVVYYIWRERNAQLHSDAPRTLHLLPQISLFVAFRVNEFVRCPLLLGFDHSFETRTCPAGRPGLGTGPGLSKNPPRSWPGETRSTRNPGDPGKLGWDPTFFLYILKRRIFSCTVKNIIRAYHDYLLKGHIYKMVPILLALSG
jgi:hypothetical protein